MPPEAWRVPACAGRRATLFTRWHTRVRVSCATASCSRHAPAALHTRSRCEEDEHKHPIGHEKQDSKTNLWCEESAAMVLTRAHLVSCLRLSLLAPPGRNCNNTANWVAPNQLTFLFERNMRLPPCHCRQRANPFHEERSVASSNPPAGGCQTQNPTRLNHTCTKRFPFVTWRATCPNERYKVSTLAGPSPCPRNF